ncbi:hypothetical protein Dsin_012311 [Dipteronia sinensis]|uniref:DUF8040 domain-containing protein n=1 Tax=Dipteronia sinensis TaxID=43782 RepID=A0AAE0AI15_9ROSI|nr:hypothetical protein Dsin_012311 [Dipteronia sinensis]
MDRNAFAMLCNLLKTRGGLLDDGNATIDEQIATFVNILAHHNKNRSIQGSATDSRVLRDAITRHNGLKVPFGNIDMSERRNWTLEEEDVMINILEGTVSDDGKCDTVSFRSYTRSRSLQRCEKN